MKEHHGSPSNAGPRPFSFIQFNEDYMKISELQEKAHRISKENGFWDDFERVCRVVRKEDREMLTNAMDAFYSQKLSLTHSELSEGLEALREGNFQEKDGLEEELADTVIRILDLAGRLEFDLEKAIIEKMDKNKDREEKHGKNF